MSVYANGAAYKANGGPHHTSKGSTGAENSATNGHNGTSLPRDSDAGFPIAICGIGLRLPGGLETPDQLWEFLMPREMQEAVFPIATEYGYFLDDKISMGHLDTSRFSLSRTDLEATDPQHRIMLEVARECIDDAGEVNFKGRPIGCYVGNFGEEFLDLQNKDPLQADTNKPEGIGEFMLSNRVSYEMDLRGPCMTIRTACSSALVALNEARVALEKGDCESAIVGGSSLILGPGNTATMSQYGVLSPEGSSKSFSADADGYARAEAISAIYIKPLEAAIRDGNPIRAVIRSTATNFDGKTAGVAHPSADAQEALLRKAYKAAGITDFSKTAVIECHATGTPVGDPIETDAIARVFGDWGVYLGSVKPNLGHGGGASGLTALIKSVLALEHKTIPPNIKFNTPNPNIPFKERRLEVPVEPTPWPESKAERIGVSSFGMGGINAHVIVDSAASFNISSPGTESRESHELLVLSANTAASLKNMTAHFQNWFAKAHPNNKDLAYTLSLRREHFPHRAFFIAQGDHLSEVSQTRKSTAVSPNLVMKELMKPAKLSKIQKAELSQPLCTAIQIALVDILASVGIEPAAVVGHSSGEIAAAYASGALTAKEAIITSWKRGMAAEKQTKRGAMAAIGLGWEETKPLLSENVVIACENSPKSVTISGDVSEVKETVARIRENHPDVIARLLKVDKAYHSHHMREIGNDYCAMIEQDIVGKAPQKPFFSSVLGERTEQPLGAKYWQSNLESPVLFKTAVSKILEHFEHTAFLEIGPHFALAGPLRQILGEASRPPLYESVMSRGANCVESYLRALGGLFELNVPFDFARLTTGANTLAGLPPYSWDHQVEYWKESRISKDWRQRQYPAHPLLGLSQLESTSLEPSWRNMCRVNEIPWVRDHMIEENIIFPAAGYISIVAEAIRQVSGSEDGFALRHVLINAAMVLNEDEPTEIVTTFRPHRLTDSTDSQWVEFVVASYNGHVWMKHCSGQVTAKLGEAEAVQRFPVLPRPVKNRSLYQSMDESGLRFGPTFQRLANVRTGTLEGVATADVVDLEMADAKYYAMHPTIIDACLQVAPIAAFKGRVLAKHYRRVPTKIESLILRPISASARATVSASATLIKGSGEVVSQTQQVVVGDQVALSIHGMNISPLEEAEVISHDSLQNTARFVWKPHLDFLDTSKLIKPVINWKLHYPVMQELAHLGMMWTHQNVHQMQTEIPHLIKFMAWLKDQMEVIRAEAGPASSYFDKDQQAIMERIDELVEEFKTTDVAVIARGIKQLAVNVEAILKGEKDSLEVLLEDDLLNQIYAPADASDRSLFIQGLAHTKPNLRILEIGAGTGASTASMLSYLVLPGSNAQPMYSKYTYTDISSGFFVAAKDRFKNYRGMEYKTLDISKDPVEQGFKSEQYDLIIATNVIHATHTISESLANVRKLLAPNGRFLLHELHTGSKWPNFIFGIVPGWWLGEADGRPDQPYVTPERWNTELKNAGFTGVDQVALDGEYPYQLNAIMIARPAVGSASPQKSVTLLSEKGATHKGALTRQLEARGYAVDHCRLGDELPPSQDVISFLDCDRPFFKDIDENTLAQLQKLMASIGNSKLFWVTHGCQVKCTNPDFAQVIGMARAARVETLSDFATCEVDDMSASLDVVVDVFVEYQKNQGDETLRQDYEFAIMDGTVMVPRAYPIVMKDEMTTGATEHDQMVLEATKPGRLTSLQWSPRERSRLSAGDVEVEVHAAGLNFKDVLGALNVVPYPDAGLGAEGAGVVRRVGPEVKDLKVGDRVMFLMAGAFTTHAVVPDEFCMHIPDNLSYDDAATMPAVYVTTIEALINVGSLSKGQTILIHSACGGVGIAAINLAQMVGAEIYATVSNEDKVKLLTETYGIPRNRIFNSRDTSFYEGVMRETNGVGVDLALNFLAGELLHTTWRCIAEFGKMIEIGKRDLLEAGQLDMAGFLAGRSYHGVFVDMLITRPSHCKRILKSLVGHFDQGHIGPVKPTTVYDAGSVQEAFRFMQQGLHIGKLVISLRGPDGSLKINTELVTSIRKLKLDESASYLLAGGLGGLGRSVARYLVENGARHIVFLSRSAGSGPDDQEFVVELESLGCKVQLVQGSVNNRDDVVRAVSASQNLKGILQASMVLRDENFAQMKIEDWRTTIQPKVEGTWNLHHATLEAKIDLDFFICFSSMSGTTGLAGQSNYACANTFLDAFAQYRQSLGLPATSIDLGAVRDAGYVARDEALLKRMKVTGSKGVTELEVLEAVPMSILSKPVIKPEPAKNTEEAEFVDQSNLVLGLLSEIPLSSAESRALWKNDRRMAVYHNSSTDASDGSGSGGDVLKAFLSNAKKDASVLKANEPVQLLAVEIGRKLFSFLLKSEDELDTSVSLSSLGLDSLVGVEMRSWWRQTFGFDITVLEMLGMGTLEGLGKHASQGMLKLTDSESG
uniref:Carrier domain-containing protein n=1 Tax=Bionectria ochroleuca TaxID=29856 RepID=A0A8H7KAW2_BIOOC